MKIVAYKYSTLESDSAIVIEGKHGAIYMSRQSSGFKRMKNVGVPLSSLIVKFGFKPVQNILEAPSNPAYIKVTAEGVKVL